MLLVVTNAAAAVTYFSQNMARVICIILLILASTCKSSSDQNLKRQFQRGHTKQGDIAHFIFRKSQPQTRTPTPSIRTHGNGTGNGTGNAIGKGISDNADAHAPHKHDTRHAHWQWQTLNRKIQVGTANLNNERSAKMWKWNNQYHDADEIRRQEDGRGKHDHDGVGAGGQTTFNDGMKMDGDKTATASEEFVPGQNAKSFAVDTLNGTLKFPSIDLLNKSIIFQVFDNRSAFLQCLWTSEVSLKSISGSPDSVHYIFMSSSYHAKQDAVWMQNQLTSSLETMTSEGELR